MWGLLAVGTFGLVWFLKSRSGSSSVPAAVGDLSGLPASTGVTTTDPLTAEQLLAQMQAMAAQITGSTSGVNPSNAFLQYIGGPGQNPLNAPGAGETFDQWATRMLDGYIQRTGQLPAVDWNWMRLSYERLGGSGTSVGNVVAASPVPLNNPLATTQTYGGPSLARVT